MGQRRALLKSLMNNLVIRGEIETTDEKAKEMRPQIEKLLTIGKKQDLAGLRILLARLPKKAAEKIFYELAPRYKDKRGGYVRIAKAAKLRKGDGARMARIEFI